ncbi:MAG: HAMP domain-containing histidine kinase, partial [Actinomycetota bacterium]|nr:HAMP domain-containing histidine kinase [Actinomycetota bacterium]
MVELSTGTTVAIAGGVAALVAALVLALWLTARRARSVTHRLAVVATRLDLPGAASEDDRDSVTRLERLAQAAVLRVSDADARADRLAGVLGELPQGVVVCDERGEVVYRNEQAGALEGADAGAGLVAEAVGAVLRAAVGGERSSRTVEVLGPPRRTLAVSGRPVDDGRRTVGAVAVIDDVSERRRFELIRRDFLTNVTAEIKAPVGALGLLAAAIVDEDDPTLTRRLARRLEQDALRVGRLVDDLAELSRLDAEALPAREPVPVHLLVAQAVEEVRSLAVHRTVSIDAREAPSDLTVVGDRRQLVSALRHLVENAVKFGEEGTAVRLRVTVAGEWVDIAVQDKGPGIPGRDLDRVFECFYRAERSRTRDAAGTGLGLAIASQVAGGHGGQVTVASREGRGSTFTLRLPAAPGARSAA